jgi:solute carrier family 25 S-adenosylmethionine transporter 26
MRFFILPLLLLLLALLSCDVACGSRDSRQKGIVPTQRGRGKKDGVVFKQMIAGGLGRSLAQMTLYPIDALRTLAQTRDGRTLADVGVSSLVRGCATTSTFALFMGSIQFSVYEGCRQSVGPLLASATSAVSSCVVSVPQEVIKQRLVTGVYSSFREAVSTIYSTEGVRGFYNSWKPTMSRNVPFVMTTFMTMELLKNRRLKATNREGEELHLSESIVIGISSAMVGGLLTNPADVVKTRMMTQASSMQVPYKSALDCLSTIVKSEGPLTLYAGLRQRSVYMCSLWGMTFAINGQVKKYLEEREDSST